VAEIVPVTLVAKLQEAPAGSAAPARLMLFELATAVIVPPPQLPVNPLGEDTVRPDGKVSVKPMPLSDSAAFGFERLKVSAVVPFNATLAAPKTFAIVGGSLAGGEPPAADEPPPQLAFQSRLKAAARHSDTACDFLRNAGAFTRSSL
jgi:hypothetical protein